jgi:acetoin utilization protein AcuA
MSRALRTAIWRGPRDLDGARVAADFGAIVRSDRLPAVFRGIFERGGTIIAAADDELRGYAALVPSSALKGERWEALPDLFELGSIEVARSSRGRGVGAALLSTLGDALPLERVILFARGIASHWDLPFTELPLVEHRRKLLRMLARVGFQRWDTDDPEIGDSPLNFLAVRAGLRAPSASLLAFAQRAREDSNDA